MYKCLQTLLILSLFSTSSVVYAEKKKITYYDQTEFTHPSEKGMEKEFMGFMDWWPWDPEPVNTWNFEKVMEVDTLLAKHIKGQPEAISMVGDALIRYAANLSDPNKPIAVFLFVGPTGVGKTELTKAIAREFLGSEEPIIRLNMADYTQYDVWRLIGSSPGYVHHEEGGQLTEAIKKNPYSIVLLDEIEKSDPAVQKIFLPVFDEGFILDSKNTKIDCKNCLFIMTSNLFSQTILNMSHQGMNQEEILEQIQPDLIKRLSPELYNRTEPVVFQAIKKEVFRELIDLMLAQVITNIKEKKNITLTVDKSVINYLEDNGYSAELGARPLKKLIENKVVSNVARAIMKEHIPNGSSIEIFYETKSSKWIIEWE